MHYNVGHLFCVFKKQKNNVKEIENMFLCNYIYLYFIIWVHIINVSLQTKLQWAAETRTVGPGGPKILEFLGYLPDQGDLRLKKIYDIFQTHTGK